MIKSYLSFIIIIIISILFTFLIGKYISLYIVPINMFSASIFFLISIGLFFSFLSSNENLIYYILKTFSDSIYIYYLFYLIGISNFTFLIYILTIIILLLIEVLINDNIKIKIE